jgi:D-alanyl-D-alanine carboxypeptidase
MAPLVIVSLAWLAAGPRPCLPDGASLSRAEALLRGEVSSDRTPAVQYRHFTVDSVLVSFDHGLADVARGARAGATTTFHGFSVTKTVTALAVLQLVDRGHIDLDAPAADYLPDIPYGPEITVRQLLAHSAGLPNPMPVRWTHLVSEAGSFDADGFFDALLARHSRVKSPPNRRYAYSNLGYVLLGRIIEGVTGVGYQEYVTTNILDVIGLLPAELGFVLDPARHATGYHRRRSISRLLLPFLMDTRTYLKPAQNGWQPFEAFYVNGAAYGGLVGTADGFARYLQALLDPASGLISDESRRMLFTDNVLSGGDRSGMALSWHLGELAGVRYAAHAGGGGGYYAEIRVYPELQRGSVLLFNRSGFSDARFLDRVDGHVLARPDRTARPRPGPPGPDQEPDHQEPAS